MMDSFSHIPSGQAVNLAKQQLDRLAAQGGVAEGFHGTSATAARSILQHGFRDAQPGRLSQMSAVYFTDGVGDDVLAGAREYGINKALWRGEREYAVFKARFVNPQADYLTGAPHWAVSASNIQEYSVEFYAVPEDRQPTTYMKLWQYLASFFSR